MWKNTGRATWHLSYAAIIASLMSHIQKPSKHAFTVHLDWNCKQLNQTFTASSQCKHNEQGFSSKLSFFSKFLPWVLTISYTQCEARREPWSHKIISLSKTGDFHFQSLLMCKSHLCLLYVSYILPLKYIALCLRKLQHPMNGLHQINYNLEVF